MLKQGTTLACFEDLMRQLQLLPDVQFYEKRKQLAELLGVEDPTVRRWMRGTVPLGEPMIALRVYLDFLGYRVDEFVRLSQTVKDAARLLALRILTLSEMTHLVEYTTQSQTLVVLRGIHEAVPERQERFEALITAYRAELTVALGQWPRLIPKEGVEDKNVPTELPKASPQAPALSSIVVAEVETALVSDDKRASHFKWLVLMLTDHARHYTNQDLPEEVRDALRHVVGQRNIFDLKNLLVRLCGSTAFKQTQP